MNKMYLVGGYLPQKDGLVYIKGYYRFTFKKIKFYSEDCFFEVKDSKFITFRWFTFLKVITHWAHADMEKEEQKMKEFSRTG